jgi:diacylglycerol kinase family enzyme
MLPRLYFRGPPQTHAQVRFGRCRRLRIESGAALTIHTDGEMYSTPEDAVKDVEIRILPGRLRAKVCPPT